MHFTGAEVAGTHHTLEQTVLLWKTVDGKNEYDQNKLRQMSDKIAVCQPGGQLTDASPHLPVVLVSRQQGPDCEK